MMKQSAAWVPSNRISLTGNEMSHVVEALTQNHLAGDGPFTRKVSALLEQALMARRVLMTTSCTHALEMAALLLGLQPGDEVILPSFTFVSTANAFVLRGAVPRFIDIRPDTLNLDEALLEDLITPRTKAIVPVHYAGVACEMDRILEIAGRHGIAVVEDNAHGIFGRYRGRLLGTFGALGALSFHETKNFTCGEGGALLVNDSRFAEAAEIIREKGTNRSLFLRGSVDKYTWVATGSSYLPADVLMAVLSAQLECREQIQQLRRGVWEGYFQRLGDWATDNSVQLPTVPGHCDQSYHLFYMLMPSPESRAAFIEHLRGHNISSSFHYLPLHLSKMGISYGGFSGACPVTERVSERLVRLPFFTSLSEAEQDRVVEAVRSFRCKAGRAAA